MNFTGASPGLTVWRRRWDSNPRGACAPNGFRVRAVMSTSVPLHRLPAGRSQYCIRIRIIRVASDSAKSATKWIFFSLQKISASAVHIHHSEYLRPPRIDDSECHFATHSGPNLPHLPWSQWLHISWYPVLIE